MREYKIPNSWLLDRVNIALIGCGGTGSEMFDELYRIHTLLTALGGEGIKVTAYDPSLVTAANIGRQRFWGADVGYPKSEVLVNRVNNFGGVNWRFSTESITCADSLRHYDLIITCVDTPGIRAVIGEHACRARTEDRGLYKEQLWLDCGNDNHSGNVILGHIKPTKEGLTLPNVYDLYPVLNEMDNTDIASCSTQEALLKQDYGINRSIAREAANILWQLFRHGSINHHGSYINIKAGTVSPLKIDPTVWALFAA